MFHNDKNQELKKKKVAIYLRVSTDAQEEEGYGLEAQRDAINKFLSLKSDEFELVSEDYVYIDSGVSGTIEGPNRPAFGKLMDDIKSGMMDFDTVIVARFDRFARALSVLLNIVDFFKENDKNFISIKESIDTNSPFGRAMLSILGVFSELELNVIKERMRGGRNMALQNGERMKATYGYHLNEKNKYEIIESEAEVVKRIFDYYLNRNLSVYDICNQLRTDNIRKPTESRKDNAFQKGIIGIICYRSD